MLGAGKTAPGRAVVLLPLGRRQLQRAERIERPAEIAVALEQGPVARQHKDDMVNAGGQWSDSEVVVDGNLITSRKPDDLPAFCREIVRALTKTG
jgi:putative intracellular protease/amidase